MEAPEFSAHHDSPSGQAPLSFSHQAREAREALSGMEGGYSFLPFSRRPHLLSFASSSVLNPPDFSRLDSLTSIQSCVEHLELDAAVRPLAENDGPIAERSLPLDSLVSISPPTRREPPFSLHFLLSQLPLFPLHAQSSPTQQRQSHNSFTRMSVIPVPH